LYSYALEIDDDRHTVKS